MEKKDRELELVQHIRSKIDKGNMIAFTILTNFAVELMIKGYDIDSVKKEIDNLCKPTSVLKKKIEKKMNSIQTVNPK